MFIYSNPLFSCGKTFAIFNSRGAEFELYIEEKERHSIPPLQEIQAMLLGFICCFARQEKRNLTLIIVALKQQQWRLFFVERSKAQDIPK